MRAKYAREIRRGIVTARDVVARRRVRPSLTWGDERNYGMPLWEIAYRREMDAMVRDGRIRPPRGPSGVSR